MRLLILAGAAVFPLLVTLAVETRYVSADGDDARDGMTERTAWRTLSRLDKGLPAGGEGRLRRGDVYDVAFTMQGRNSPHSWENIHVTDCVIVCCTYL